jgi:digeranylgeranylglycerophospholipid reductase
MKIDAAVIGAGPAGLLAAESISKNGFNVEVFEEHRRIGYPVHCAGIISVEGFNRLNIKPVPSLYQNKIFGGKVFSKNGSCLTIRDRRPRAYIVDRGRFDSFLAERAINNGVRIKTGCRVEKINFVDGVSRSIKSNDRSIESQIFINAEGAGARLLKRSGFNIEEKNHLVGYNTELDVSYIDSDLVEVWFDQKIAKNFFIWVIPLGETRVRCGLATSEKNGITALRDFIKKRFKTSKMETIQSGLVCTNGPLQRTVYQGLMLVGDVAGQVKPTTGGGVVIGGLCALLAGKIGSEALEREDLNVLYNYETDWRKMYNSELKTMLLLRNIFNQISDERINRIFQSFKNGGLETKLTDLTERGDMDMQSGVIKQALRDPDILISLGRSLGRLALTEILSLLGI